MKHLIALSVFIAASACAAEEMTKVGDIRTLQHGVRGTVFAKDERTLVIKDFHYDGTGPDAFFYVGKSGSPSGAGKLVRYPPGQDKVRKRIRVYI